MFNFWFATRTIIIPFAARCVAIHSLQVLYVCKQRFPRNTVQINSEPMEMVEVLFGQSKICCYFFFLPSSWLLLQSFAVGCHAEYLFFISDQQHLRSPSSLLAIDHVICRLTPPRVFAKAESASLSWRTGRWTWISWPALLRNQQRCDFHLTVRFQKIRPEHIRLNALSRQTYRPQSVGSNILGGKAALFRR